MVEEKTIFTRSLYRGDKEYFVFRPQPKGDFLEIHVTIEDGDIFHSTNVLTPKERQMIKQDLKKKQDEYR